MVHSTDRHREAERLRCRRALTLLELLVCVAILGILTGLILAAVQSARAAAARINCANNLRQFGLAFHQFHDAHSVLPPGTTRPSGLADDTAEASDPYPLLNWGGRLLPYLDQASLFAAIAEVYRTDRHVTGPGLPALGQTPLKVFRCPADYAISIKPPAPHLANNSNYLGIAGRSYNRCDGLLYLGSAVALGQVTDGTSNTLLVSERPINEFTHGGSWHGGWGRAPLADAFLGVCETAIATDICPNFPYPFQRSTKVDPCSAFHFWSFHAGGANFLFADGSVRFLPYAANAVLPALASRDGGESVEF